MWCCWQFETLGIGLYDSFSTFLSYQKDRSCQNPSPDVIAQFYRSLERVLMVGCQKMAIKNPVSSVSWPGNIGIKIVLKMSIRDWQLAQILVLFPTLMNLKHVGCILFEVD